MEVEHCIRGDGEAIRNLLHRIKRTVNKGWPYDMNGIEPAQQKVERAAQEDKGDKGTWTAVCKDLDLDISNGKLKSI